LLIPLALLTACAGQPEHFNPFNEREDFAAQRELETIDIDHMDRESACAHVAEVLMDLDCALGDVNSELGLLTGQSKSRWINGEGMFAVRRYWRACGGSNVTVSVDEGDHGNVRIRAAFEPPSPEADRAFRTLLRRSIARAEAE
jgi:hypothetical protein